MVPRPLTRTILLLTLLGGCDAVLGYDSATLVTSTSSDDAGAADPNGCAAYCTDIQAACTHENTEYLNYSVCIQMCGAFETGLPGAITGNTLACRISHTAAARSDPATNCRAAGPLGGGVCGTQPCDVFCPLVEHLCSTQPSPPYSSESACDAACPAFVYNTTTDGDLTQPSDNTLNCRLYHLESAFDTQDNPNATSYHCPHTAVVSETCY